jgi:hypothetical protein
MASSSPDRADFALAELCEKELGSTIANDLISFGLAAKNPRAIWQLGYYLLEEHFHKEEHCRRLQTELINRETWSHALKTLTGVVSKGSLTGSRAIATDLSVPKHFQFDSEPSAGADAFSKLADAITFLTNALPRLSGGQGEQGGVSTSVSADSIEGFTSEDEKSIRQFIEDDQFQKAIDLIKKKPKSDNDDNDAVLLSFRFNEMEATKRSRELTREAYLLEKGLLATEILDFIVKRRI